MIADNVGLDSLASELEGSIRVRQPIHQFRQGWQWVVEF